MSSTKPGSLKKARRSLKKARRALIVAGSGLVIALSVAACTLTPVPTDSPTASVSAKPKAGTGDPCTVLSLVTLEKISGLSGLSSQPTLGKTKNGCHWGTPGQPYSVSYDVLPIRGSADGMIAAMQAAGGQGGALTKVDLGNGHVGLTAALDDPQTGVASGTANLFLSDRYAIIVVILPTGSDAGSIAIAMGKAFSAVADSLPAAPVL